MKHSMLLAISASLLAGTALAGSTEAPVFPVTQIAAAAATDWSGFYAGGMVSFSGETEYSYYALGILSDGGNLAANTAFGVFAGYNFQRGAFVYGGEAAIDTGGIGTAGTNLQYGPIIDVKARAGYAFGQALLYGVVGGSFATFETPNAMPVPNYPGGGLVYGAGLDYRINDQLFVGVEYLIRDLAGASDSEATYEIKSNIQSAQLRVGWKF